MKDEITRLLKPFISFKSVAESQIQKQECIDWISASFFGERFSSSKRGVFDKSPWIYLPNPDSKLLVFAHVDIVPGADSQFELQVEGDKAIGRGTSDMKGNILPFLMAYRDATTEGENPPVSILITTDEEVGGLTIPHLLDEQLFSEPAAYTPDSNDLGIVIEHKGVAWVDMTVTGVGGHGAYPWDTKNPNILLAEAISILTEKFPTGEHDDWQITVTPTSVQSSGAQNQIPGTASAVLDVRFPGSLCNSADEAIALVQEVLPEYCTLKTRLTASPLQTSDTDPMVALFKQVAEEVIGESIPFKREHGGTDARYFSERGIPAFLYGPKGAGLHGDNEWVSLSSLEKHYEMYRELFKQLSL
jgi:succinyl-diaminopimelate desuccinylase